ncbi:hypothetical protein KPL70_016982 [Citrus sinensis]|nr:hypothetical protein KPL70_016982 [Citrus sinensis]
MNGKGIPVEPVTFVFEGLTFSRYEEGSNESTPLFSYVTCYAKPQNMFALLGGSRTSKVTLLQCLAERIPFTGSLNGNVLLLCYVEKLDAHQTYSVSESIQFSAALRVGKTVNAMRRHIHVELVLNQLGLLPYSNQLVGSLHYHCPSILLLEEPLSGVDTIGTLTILNILSLCQIRSGHYCLSNTPYARTVPFFDLALILTKEGHQAYFGPRGSNHDIILDYFLLIPKNPRYSKRESPVRLTGCTMIDILMGSLYFRIEYKDIFGVTSHSLCIYMQVILIGVISANNVISQIGTDSCWDWQWHSRNRNRICSEFMSTIANASSLSCVNSYINMGVSFRCGGCPSRHKVLQLDVVD